MSKKGYILQEDAGNGILTRGRLKQMYDDKYFNLFMNKYEWEGIDVQQKEFLMQQLWSVGTIAAFPPKGLTADKMLVFAPYAVSEWNIYNYPIKCTLIQRRPVGFFPNGLQTINKDVVIGWVQRSHKPVYDKVCGYILKIVDVEMTIRSQLSALKTPWVIATTPENEKKVRFMFDRLDEGENVLYDDDVRNFNVLQTGVQNHIEMLYAYKCALENEIKEYLGIDNLGVNEKKEHLITAEIGANDQITQTHDDIFFDCMTEFCDKIQEVFGVNVTVKKNTPETPQKDILTEGGEEIEEDI